MRPISSTIILIAAAVGLAAAYAVPAVSSFSLRKERAATTAAAVSTVRDTNRRGDLYSSENTLLVTSAVTCNDEGEEASWRAITPAYDTALGNIIGTYTGGIDAALAPLLREDNPTVEPDGRGCSVRLTLSDQTLGVYEELAETQQITAGVVVISSEGALRCLCSTPSFQHEQFRVSERYRTSLNGSAAMNNHVLEPLEIPQEILEPLLRAECQDAPQSTALVNRIFRDELFLEDMKCDFGVLKASSDAESRTSRCSIIQLASILSALPNGGNIYKPYVMNQMLDTVSHQPIGEETVPSVIGTLRHADAVELSRKAVIDTADGWLCYAVGENATVVMHVIDTTYDGIETREDAAQCFERLLVQTDSM